MKKEEEPGRNPGTCQENPNSHYSSDVPRLHTKHIVLGVSGAESKVSCRNAAGQGCRGDGLVFSILSSHLQVDTS